MKPLTENPTRTSQTLAEHRSTERVRRMLFLRLAVVLGCLAVVVLSQGRRGAFEAELVPTYVLLMVISLVNVVYMSAAGSVRNVRRFARVQIILDLVFASCLIYVTGAAHSNITFLYFACILAASTVLGLRPGMTVASLATAMLAGMRMLTFFAGHYGWELPWVYPLGAEAPALSISSSVGYLLAQAIAYHLVAALAGRLARGLSGVRLLNEKILASISDGVLAVDNDRRVHAVNREAVRLLGILPETSLMGMTLDEVFDRSPNAAVMKRLFVERRPGVNQLTLTTADGGSVPAAVFSSALTDEGHNETGLVVMLIDLSERQRLEEAVARAETMETVGQLAASIAHEIRNPLACIRGSAQEVRSELVADEQSMKLLDMVVRESDRINAIVTDFLHFSKMRCTALKRCNVTDALTDVVTMLESRSREPDVEIVFNANEPVSCLGDVEQLRQVFLNLGLNALDAMSDGGRLEVTVRRRPDESGSRVVVAFIDHGEGMTDEVRRRLFDPFFTTKPRGTGLGLAIVRRIVEAHQGHIEVDSRPGRGTTVRVVLNACVDADADASYPDDAYERTPTVATVGAGIQV